MNSRCPLTLFQRVGTFHPGKIRGFSGKDSVEKYLGEIPSKCPEEAGAVHSPLDRIRRLFTHTCWFRSEVPYSDASTCLQDPLTHTVDVLNFKYLSEDCLQYHHKPLGVPHIEMQWYRTKLVQLFGKAKLEEIEFYKIIIISANILVSKNLKQPKKRHKAGLLNLPLQSEPKSQYSQQKQHADF